MAASSAFPSKDISSPPDDPLAALGVADMVYLTIRIMQAFKLHEKGFVAKLFIRFFRHVGTICNAHLTLALVVSRWLSVYRPLHVHRLLEKRRIVASLVLLLLWSGALAALSVLPIVWKEGYFTMAFNRLYVLKYFVQALAMGVPSVILVLYNVSLARFMCRRAHDTGGIDPSSTDEHATQLRRGVAAVVCVSVITLLAYPVALVIFNYFDLNYDLIVVQCGPFCPHMVYVAVDMMKSINSTATPFIYVIFASRFRKLFSDFFWIRCKSCRAAGRNPPCFPAERKARHGQQPDTLHIQSEREIDENRQSETETYGQRQSETETAGLTTVTYVQIQSGAETDGQSQSEMETDGQRQSETETYVQRQSGSETDRQRQSRTEINGQRESGTDAEWGSDGQRESGKDAEWGSDGQRESGTDAEWGSDGQRESGTDAEWGSDERAEKSDRKERAETERDRDGRAETEWGSDGRAETQTDGQRQSRAEINGHRESGTDAEWGSDGQRESGIYLEWGSDGRAEKSDRKGRAETERDRDGRAETEWGSDRRAETQTDGQRQSRAEINGQRESGTGAEWGSAGQRESGTDAEWARSGERKLALSDCCLS